MSGSRESPQQDQLMEPSNNAYYDVFVQSEQEEDSSSLPRITHDLRCFGIVHQYSLKHFPILISRENLLSA